ncbi:dna-directed rna polymerases i and iii subunit rpac2-like [Plasmopara halstedii]|uniref:DNA-directed RNA polymerases I and III subunit RPAC2 n=1 Tax=Plasmopara halstedii TaxID=4781 RepID=A0A0P1ABG4_PLAHL|nr:dna-directed rna polymerases i and iii subunit rpac2-like [Plasmopara halstedii]CEG38170.1 dna-directed rna polymerases i and iii subunit rpac2-like [Plasmopara halstedii]|eukprot:XP_024574539.1 dna-directed rna polymerases i and iii subunit rpac2-like [Plasmopara halstedii]
MAAAAKKLDVFSTTSEYSKTYVFHDEDHTLGNALRYVLMRNPDVDFCGYTIPHPSEPKMHIRLQTRQGAPADEVLRSGLTDLRKISMQIGDAYRKELKSFKRKNTKS